VKLNRPTSALSFFSIKSWFSIDTTPTPVRCTLQDFRSYGKTKDDFINLYTNLKKHNIKELRRPFSQFLFFFFFRFLTLQAAGDSVWYIFWTTCDKKGNGVRDVCWQENMGVASYFRLLYIWISFFNSNNFIWFVSIKMKFSLYLFI